MRRILFEVPGLGFEVAGFSLALAFATVGALWLTAWRARREGIDPDRVYDLGLWLISGGFLGARGLFLATHPETVHGVADLFKVWRGGIVFYGCILGGLLGALIDWRRRPFPFLAMADAVAPSLALGLAFGRVGCFLNGCCWGAATSLPWAVRFPRESLPWSRHVADHLLDATSNRSLPIHPTQLYSALDGLLILALLTAFFPRRKRDGEVMALLMVTYPITRFLIEALRSDEPAIFAGMTLSQAISVGIFLSGLAFRFHLSRRPEGRYRDEVEAAPPIGSAPMVSPFARSRRTTST